MRVVITGATGLIGTALATSLREDGHEVVALSRDRARAAEALGAGVECHSWPDPTGTPPPGLALHGADAVVHLMGEPVAQRWSGTAKQAIRVSREQGTRQLVAGLAALPADERPKVLVSQSASGFYGPRGEEEVAESEPPGSDFLAEVVQVWEGEARKAEDLGVRVVVTRTGVVLSPRGGALAKMLPPFRAGIGGPVAGGRQYLPWIHLEDVVGALTLCAAAPGARGPVNLAAPEAASNRELSRCLGRVLHRPAVLPVPGLALRLLYGEMATIVTTGARLVPARLLELGYTFRHPSLEPALRDVLGR